MSKKIDQQLFSAPEQALASHPCPQCQSMQRQGTLSMRSGKHGLFFGCDQYPVCDYIEPVQQNDGHVVKELGVACPQCGNQLLLRQGRYGMFIGCSHYPDCEHIEPLNPAEQAPSSAHTCPECQQGHMVARKSRFGKLFYACDHYPKCKFAVNQAPVAGQCEKCGFPLLVEKKLASGVKTQCAERKCHHIQTA